ncbi:MAG: hypothetical protein ACRCS0_11235 [Albidovulum sp.]
MPAFGTMPIPARLRRMRRAAWIARILLVLCSAFAFGLAGGPAAHGTEAAQTLVSVIICGDGGAEVIQMDMGGGPAEHPGDCSQCTSCLSHYVAALTPEGLGAARNLSLSRAGKSPALRLRQARTMAHFLATGPPASERLSGHISCSVRRAADEASPGLTIVNTKPSGSWQGSGRSAKEAGR